MAAIANEFQRGADSGRGPGAARCRTKVMATTTIGVGTDGSSTAECAVVKADELARALDASLHVVNCYSGYGSASWAAAAGGIAVSEVAVAEAREQEAEAVRRAQAIFSDLRVPAFTHVCEGDPVQALMTIADDVGAQMIVVGNQRMTGAKRMWSVPTESHTAPGAAPGGLNFLGAQWTRRGAVGPSGRSGPTGRLRAFWERPQPSP